MKSLLILVALVAGNADAKAHRKPSSAEQVTKVGKIEKGHFGGHSKSSSTALFLKTEDGEKLKLRAPGQNPFEIDAKLGELVGKEASCKGVLADYELIDAVCKAED